MQLILPLLVCDLRQLSYNSRPARDIQVLGNGPRGNTELTLALRRPVSDAEETISKKKKSLKEKSATKVRNYESHVLVCTGSDCKKRGAKETRKAIKSEVRAKGLLGEVRVDTVNCLGLCKHGPNAVVYDGAVLKGTWYLGLDESDAPEVVEQHLKNGEPVERLAAQRRPRKEKKTRK
jgi:(2Fe-2S) ferredoxin